MVGKDPEIGFLSQTCQFMKRHSEAATQCELSLILRGYREVVYVCRTYESLPMVSL